MSWIYIVLVCHSNLWLFGNADSDDDHHHVNKDMALHVKKDWELNDRLPPPIKPRSYQLKFHPDLVRGTFSGTSKIDVDISLPVSYLALHIKGLQVSKTELYANDSTSIELEQTLEYKKHEFWVLVPKNQIPPGYYKLALEFSGVLTHKIIGFYRSVYHDPTGKERYIATTKFEPTYARQAFPCFDEPSFKATFEIELVRPSNDSYIALSNMNIKEESLNEPCKGFTTVTFNKTPKMSTYLVCFIVCDFDHTKAVKSDQGFPVTVYARSEHVPNVEYAKEIALKSVNYYLKYFEIEYPLPKLDLIAIPDFVSGAMENWGLITFRETSILYNPKITSTSNQLRVALTVAHELAHMWFGDLVTMRWWNDLWLNEGFASYMEFKAVNHCHPDWEADALFLLHDLQSVLELDARVHSHPIVQNVSNPDEITASFDVINYRKGSSIIRMLENAIGEEVFRRGVTSYMKKYQFKNTQTEDLWAELGAQTKIPVANFMRTFTLQMGFPVVMISRPKPNVIVFTQKRFLNDPNATYENVSPYGYKWNIPITFRTSERPNEKELIWLNKEDAEVTVTIDPPSKWVKANLNQVGYYRVNYDLKNWNSLIDVLLINHNKFTPADRSGLIDDAFSLADAKEMPYDLALMITSYLRAETHYVPWATAASKFISLHKRLYNTDAYAHFLKYVRNLLSGNDVVTWEFESQTSLLKRSLQATLLEVACIVGFESILEWAKLITREWLHNNGAAPHPDIAGLVYYYGIREGSLEDWEVMLMKFGKVQNPQEKNKLMIALCGTKDPKAIKKLLSVSKDEKLVRSQDFFILLVNLANNRVARNYVWDFIRDEWNYLVDRFTLNDRYFGQLIPSVTSTMDTQADLDQLNEFIAKYPAAGAGWVGRMQAKEKIALNIAWRKNFETVLTDWFRNATESS